MSTTVTLARLMTADEFLALPDDGMDRSLICGVLREKPLAYRNHIESRLTVVLAASLENWVQTQPEPRGKAYAGDVGFLAATNPDTIVGIDVAYWSPEQLAANTGNRTILDSAPTLAVEILSPSNTVEDINEKIDIYLQSGVRLVWVVDPHVQTITAHQPRRPPIMFNTESELTAEGVLPGFRVAVAKIFD